MGYRDNDCDCDEVYASLCELINETVDATRKAELIRHINSCPGCFEKLGIEREVSELVRRCCRETAPVHLKERIIVRLRVETGSVA